MAEIAAMNGMAREGVGKGAARATRRAGRVPAIVYGQGGDPIPVSLDNKALTMAIQQGGFFSRLFDLELDGQKIRVLPRDVQVHPVTDAPLHVDLLRLSAKSEIDVAVLVYFVNEEASPGLKRGGVLNVVRHEIELRCRADSIPESIEIDLDGLDIGDSIHISAVALPEGVTPTIDRDFTVATIAAPTVTAEPAAEGEEEEEEAAAPEEGAEAEAAAESTEE